MSEKKKHKKAIYASAGVIFVCSAALGLYFSKSPIEPPKAEPSSTSSSIKRSEDEDKNESFIDKLAKTDEVKKVAEAVGRAKDDVLGGNLAPLNVASQALDILSGRDTTKRTGDLVTADVKTPDKVKEEDKNKDKPKDVIPKPPTLEPEVPEVPEVPVIPKPPVLPPVVETPTIETATLDVQSVVTLHVFDKFNPMNYLNSAVDGYGNDISDKVKITGSVNLEKAGTYHLTFSINTLQGLVSADLKIIVLNDKPVIHIPSDALIEVGKDFDLMSGVTATDTEDGDLTSKISVSGSYDKKKPGKYEIHYEVSDRLGLKAKAIRTITVYARGPVFSGVEDKTSMVGDSFNTHTGVTVTDKYDPTTTYRVSGHVDTSKTGDYTLVYYAENRYGTSTTAERTIHVDSVAAEIRGADDVAIEVETPFSALNGVSASDSYTGDLTSEIQVAGSVDVSKPGRYDLIYSVKNTHGKLTQVARKVEVFAEKPILVGVSDTDVDAGTTFDAMYGVSATDKYGSTVDITVSGTVDTEKVGTYNVTYTAKGKYGNTETVTRKVNVVADAPKFSGVKDVTLKVGDTFDNRAGVGVSDKYGTTDFDVVDNVDTSKPGTYDVTYTAHNKYVNTSIVRHVIVEDVKPIMTLLSTNVSIEAGNIFDPLAYVSVTDIYNPTAQATVSGNVNTNSIGTYPVTYSYSNQFGSSVTNGLNVVVWAQTPTIMGASNVEIENGEAFDVMAGVSYVDSYNSGNPLHVIGAVDTNTAGTYTLTYSYTNKYGAKGTVTRVVTVKPAVPVQPVQPTQPVPEQSTPPTE